MSRTDQLEALKVSIGKAAAAARTSRGWSQEYVAKKLDVDSETISRFERGAIIKLERLMDLAVLYRMPVASFFRDAPGPILPAESEIALAAASLDKKNQQWVLQMIRSVMDKLEK